MKQQLLEFLNRGKAMTCEELAGVLNISADTVRRNSKPPDGWIPRIPGIRQVRFDPARMIDVFCQTLPPGPQAPKRSGSLTIEKRNISENPTGGFRKCL